MKDGKPYKAVWHIEQLTDIQSDLLIWLSWDPCQTNESYLPIIYYLQALTDNRLHFFCAGHMGTYIINICYIGCMKFLVDVGHSVNTSFTHTYFAGFWGKSSKHPPLDVEVSQRANHDARYQISMHLGPANNSIWRSLKVKTLCTQEWLNPIN